MIPGIDWGRPLGLVALVLPVLVWIFARRDSAPQPARTGALRLWRQVAQQGPPRGERKRRPWTAAFILCLAALTLGALALGAPQRSAAAVRDPLHLLVDRSPSMFLDRDGRSRYAFALDAACAWLDERGIVPERRAWAWWRGLQSSPDVRRSGSREHLVYESCRNCNVFGGFTGVIIVTPFPPNRR